MKAKFVLPTILAGIAQAELSPLSDYVTPYVNARLRYEDRNDGAGVTSETLRARVGAKIKGAYGFGGLVEYEYLESFGDAGILDGEQDDFNQAYLSFTSGKSVIKFGRQQINLGSVSAEGGQAFVGGVAWRQNEQTYDALSFSTKAFDDLSLFVSYSDQINTILTTQGAGTATEGDVFTHSGDFVFVNTVYTGFEIPVGAYYYGLEYDAAGLEANRGGNTFGLSTKVGGLYLEAATQNGDSYYHVAYTTKLGGATVKVGAEHLTDGFTAPLSTAHKFGGFADTILGERLNGSTLGSTDFYAMYGTKLPFGVAFKLFGHYFTDDSYSVARGTEFDIVLAKEITKGVNAMIKYADFQSLEAGTGGTSADRDILTLDLNFAF